MVPDSTTVLLISPDQSEQERLQALIDADASCRLDVERVESVEDARERVSAGAAALVLYDLATAGGSGMAPLRDLLPEVEAVPVAAMGPPGDADARRAAMGAGAEHYLAKGRCTVAALLDAMERPAAPAGPRGRLTLEGLCRALVAAVDSPAAVVGADGRVLFANDFFAASAGLQSAGNAAGKHLAQYVTAEPEDADDPDATRLATFRNAQGPSGQFRMASRGVGESGARVAVFRPVPQDVEQAAPGGPGIGLLERSQRVVLARSTEMEFLQCVCDAVVAEGGYTFAWIGYAEMDDAKTVRPVCLSGSDNGYLGEARISWSEGAGGPDPASRAIRLGRPFVERALGPRAAAAGHASALAVPLVVRDRPFGCLAIYSGDLSAFGDWESALLCSVAADLSLGVAQRRTVDRGRQSRRRLREQREGWRCAFRALPCLCAVLDRGGRLVSASDQMLQATGYAPRDVVGAEYVATFIPAQHRQEHRLLLREVVRSGSPARYVGPVIARGKEQVTGDWRIAPVLGRAGGVEQIVEVGLTGAAGGSAGAGTDVLSGLIGANSGDLVWMTDAGLNFTYASEAAMAVLGYQPEELIGMALGQLVPRGENAEELARLKMLAAGRLPSRGVAGRYVAELRHMRRNGAAVWVEVGADPVVGRRGESLGLLGISRDVTRRKRTQQESLATGHLLQCTFDAMPLAALVLDERLDVLFANRRFLSDSGLAAQQLVGSRIGDVLTPEVLSSEGLLDHLHDAVRSGCRARLRNVPAPTATGSTEDLDVLVVPISREQGGNHEPRVLVIWTEAD
jgi:PAS domain S-box-containing protein